MPTLRNAIRWLYPRGSIRRVLFGPIRGRRFRVAPDCGMGVSFALARDAFHPPWLREHVHRGMIVFDIGANRGQTMLYLAEYVGSEGRVYCFEPVRQLFEDVELNIHLNQLGHVRAFCAALGKERGRVAFGFSEAAPTTGKILDCEPVNNDASRKEQTVDVWTLDEFCREHAVVPHFLKIDVEGGAGLVLQGAEEVLERHAPGVYLELHGPEEQAAAQRYLLGRGYRAVTLTGEPVEDVTRGWQTPLWLTRP